MDLSVTMLGTAASVPTYARGLPAVLVTAGATNILFDCGEGTQRQMMRAGGFTDLDAIFLSHYHLDHWFGLAGIIKSFDLREREKPLSIYGPRFLGEKLAAIESMVGGVRYEIKSSSFDHFDWNERVKFDGFEVEPFIVDHRAKNCYGFAIVEEDRPGRLDVEKAGELGVRPGPDMGKLKAGQPVVSDYGDLVKPEQVIGEARPGRKIVYSGDTRPCDAVRAFADDADLLIHEATFGSMDSKRATETGHSTGYQAARIAKQSDVRVLMMTHISPRTTVGELLNDADLVEPTNGLTIRVASDFDRVTIPLRDRGDVSLDNVASRV